MPAASLPRRPQTLKQAKKAYRKSSAKPRLSAGEIALIERRAVLQERADTLREREARRKANIKRREERNERERETRLRMGIPSPKKGGIAYVGPSQLDLGRFLGGVVKGNVKSEGKRCRVGSSSGSEAEEEQQQQQEEEKVMLQEPQVVPMGPPPRPPLQPTSSNWPLSMPSASEKPQNLQENVPTDDSIDDEDFFVSNTQIERELSPPPKRLSPPSPPLQVKSRLSMPPPLFKPPPPPLLQEEDQSALLAQISTQDLDFTGSFTQVPLPQPPPPPQIQQQQQQQHLPPLPPRPRTPANPKTPPKQKSSISKATTDETPLILHYSLSTQDLDLASLSSSPAPQLSNAPPTRKTSADSFGFEEEGITEGDLEDLAAELEMEMESSNEGTRTFLGIGEANRHSSRLEDRIKEVKAPSEVDGHGDGGGDMQTQESEYGGTQDLVDAGSFLEHASVWV